MCYFIDIYCEEKDAALFKRITTGFTRPDSPAYPSSLDADSFTHFIVSGHCACGLYGKRKQEAPPTEIDLDRLETRLRKKYSKRKYRKLGYTDQVIEQKVHEEVQAAKEHIKDGDIMVTGYDAGIADSIVSDFRRFREAGGSTLYVLVYWSGRPLVPEGEEVSLTDLVEGTVVIEENLLYRIF